MVKDRKIPYATQWISAGDVAAVSGALKSGWLTQGPGVREFEEKAAGYCGAKYAVAVSSGTAALHIAALAAGFKAGDEVITSPITFAASANCILYSGAKPVFADIDKRTYCIDPLKIKSAITRKTRGIIPVHFGGHPCEMPKVQKLARENGLKVIEDAAHAIGATYGYRGREFKVGSCAHSDMTVFSFHPVKHITSGEGGMVTTNDEGLYRKLLLLRSHGITRDASLMEKKGEGPWYYEMVELGYNYRVSDFQCALASSQLDRLDGFVRRRREIVEMYNSSFRDTKELVTPYEKPGSQSSYHLYVVQLRSIDRKKAFEALSARGLGVNVHYIPVYTMPYYRKLGFKMGLCPAAEGYYKKAITLPLYPKMSDEDVEYVIRAVKDTMDALKA